ncbi:DUF413 domain-containing protein [Bowmanella sp. JS7-9]|uniref:Macrodomain Ori protein n=1 Tax=Pseudobowmanella zhangzhouensis TaxID=1537679 RepID=A0ABW1XJB8_9ALTE|nr:DUF413 domain-containing protein [Bowmanella sp. JS7-9]TBX20812.1 hypothetical protein TK45_13610 [Bowmanella sp. JS7-9]
MAQKTREDYLKAPFNDYKNYPYGFSRSGDFSIKEAQALHKYGNLICALADGILAPENSEDDALLAVAQGVKEPTTPAEKAWLRYQTRINRPKAASIYGRRPAAEEDDSAPSIELEAEIDD